jgi:hypothetical protein
VLCGLAIYFRDELYLFALSLIVIPMITHFRGWRTPALYIIALSLSLVPLWYFNWIEFGGPLGHHVGSVSPIDSGVGRYFFDRFHVIRTLLINGHGNQWLSFIATAPFLLLFIFFPRIPERRFKGAAILLSVLALVNGLIIMTGHLSSERPMWWLLDSNGMFAVSPVLIFAFIRKLKVDSSKTRNDREKVECQIWLLMLFFVLEYIMLSPWQNVPGIHWGCRFWLPLYPLMGVLASSTIAQWWESSRKQKPARVLILLVIGISIFAQIYSLYLLHERKSFSAKLNHLVANSPEEVVVAIGWFVPQELGTNFYDKKIFLVKNTRELYSLFELLRSKGIHHIKLVSSQPLDIGTSENKQVLNDGLNFIFIELRSMRLYKPLA